MTEKELQRRTRVTLKSGRTFKVEITYRGKHYECESRNTMAWDTLQTWIKGGNLKGLYYTPKTALESFYEQCKAINSLKKKGGAK